MEEATAEEPKTPTATPKRNNPVREARGRSASTPRRKGEKDAKKTPVRKSRDRSKSLGPGTSTRRLKHDKTPRRTSSEKKKRSVRDNPDEAKEIITQLFKMTSSKLIVPTSRNKEMERENMGSRGQEENRSK